ncbi:DUF4265 domain-containing protein [Pseudomonas sp. NFXW11]|uniref:DUF4265 domain-containing protein n=1 Tax=Pseudomonas sp. NFXW11 TaxID=2819531 RepID=UPI003CF28BB2
MDVDQQEMVIKVVADRRRTRPVYEPLHVRPIEQDVYEVLYCPGLTLNLAKGDVIAIRDPQAPAEVLKRGGNFCIHLYADEIPQALINELDQEVRSKLGGMLDGRYKGNLTLSVPARNGRGKIAEVFNRFREKSGVEWYYSNVYKNFEDPEDETLLDWWHEFCE